MCGLVACSEARSVSVSGNSTTLCVASIVTISSADTFLALPGWGKGVVWLNGFTLGRFWEKGPQKRLYIPAPLLREGENKLLILETEGRSGEVWLHDEPDLG